MKTKDLNILRILKSPPSLNQTQLRKEYNQGLNLLFCIE